MRDKLVRYPGFLIRRLQQVSVALFLGRLESFGITPLQYTLLRLIEAKPGTDQISLASQAMLDASTVKDVLERLERRGLVTRRAGEQDRRTRRVALTAEGARLLADAKPEVGRAQKELLAPLAKEEQAQLLDLMGRLLAAHEQPRAQTGCRAKAWRRARQENAVGG